MKSSSHSNLHKHQPLTMKTIIAVLLSIISLTTFAQNTDPLVGKWAFHDAHEREKLDSIGIKMLEMFFGDMSFQFDESGLYRMTMMGKEDKGKWENEKGKQIVLSSENGRVEKFEIVELTNDHLIIGMSKGAIILHRTEVTDVVVETERTFETVAATKEQIAKKWYLKKREKKNPRSMSDEMKELSQALTEGTYMDLKKNGKYEVEVLGVNQKGKWELGENNESIVLIFEDSKKIWDIHAVSENELILIKGASEERWTLSTEL